jgi:hypothetical protein
MENAAKKLRQKKSVSKTLEKFQAEIQVRFPKGLTVRYGLLSCP